jgi:hypothetical protein
MKPWEDSKTLKAFKKLSGADKVRMGFELTDVSLEILIAGIKAREPNLGLKALRQEVERCLWDVPSRVSGPSFRH